ncbi:breast carcinoma-amplified sequence 1 isoform X2 [Gouania willdenowi]|uniref:breast carcinoma-amplified sequence 1 isoform X2 n=1 Tax=Gouania willdenowi TaxID=441366 RepID=UPI001054DB15|nr:proteoglycan 4-like isoform X2 [Gouania willdenowi]
MGNENSKNEDQTEDVNISEKHQNGSVSGSVTLNGGPEIDGKDPAVVKQNEEPVTLNLAIDSTECVVIDSEAPPNTAPVSSEISAPPETPEVTKELLVSVQVPPQTPDPPKQKEEVPKKKFFGKMFKKKVEAVVDEPSVEETTISGDQVDAGQTIITTQPEARDPHQDPSQPPTGPVVSVIFNGGPDLQSSPEVDIGTSVTEEGPEKREEEERNQEEKPPVMNFFKSLVNNTKTSKKETATPDVAKDQSQKESQAAPTTTVAEVSEPPTPPKGMSIPPPPPPAPPKLEIKEPAAKCLKPTTKEEPTAAKKPESSPGKSALSKFFRPKTIKEAPQPEVEVTPVIEVQETPVEVSEPVLAVQQSDDKLHLQEETAEEILVTLEQVVEDVQTMIEDEVDPPKAGTVEAATKPEPPAAGQEEKKTGSKLGFKSLFKSKLWIGLEHFPGCSIPPPQVKLSFHGASPKTASPTPPTSPAAPAAPVKPKDETKSADTAADSKAAAGAASAAGDDAAKGLKKVEKRNSITGFFKNLVQKHSDSGGQTE